MGQRMLHRRCPAPSRSLPSGRTPLPPAEVSCNKKSLTRGCSHRGYRSGQKILRWFLTEPLTRSPGRRQPSPVCPPEPPYQTARPRKPGRAPQGRGQLRSPAVLPVRPGGAPTRTRFPLTHSSTARGLPSRAVQKRPSELLFMPWSPRPGPSDSLCRS